ncbi:MAG: hypothetical protein GC159_24255, partial [Phycisphaera sp.]|nr:hypothetical protein [Phycisphaera sp.]
GDIDVLSAEDYDNEIAWYENDGSQSFTPHSISTAASGATSVFAADVDGDGDLDVLSASRNDDKIAWYDNLGYDFGDAPSPYPTTLAEDGARHLDTGPTLGASRDAEADGTHSASADADDLIGVTPDDETGVTFGTIMVGALDATVTVNVQGGTGKLDAWIDFNGDGSFGGPGEHIFDSVDVMVGDNELTFDVPSWAVAGVTYARFRLSTAGDLAPSGAAADGEVEDYAVTIIDPAAASGVFGGENVVNNMADGASSVFAADIDGDGDMDMLSASSVDDTITWYENDGAQNFTPHTITTGADFAISVFAADVDGDGDVDVLSASSRDDTIAWYENDGAQNFTPHAISTADDVPASVFAADVDGDGDMDVLGAAFGSGIIWYENNGAQNFTPHVITNAYGAYSVFAADVDGDGDMDMLSASYFDDTIAWYENDGAENFTKHAITTTADGAVSAFAADVDGDGDTDVVGSSDFGTIAWYENDGAENFTTHAITTAINGATHVFVADVDGDGDLDVLSASDGVDTIAWHENLNFTLDVDGNGAAQPLTDGILIIRYLAGFTGTVLTSGAIGGGATRTDPTEIHDYLDASASVLDVDGDGAVQPLTDGILIIRYLAGFTDTVLTGGALGGTATRTDPAAIIAYLDALQPPASPPPLFAEQSPPEPAPLIAEDTPPSEPSAPVTVSPEPKVDLLAIVSALAATRDPSPAFINPHSGDPNGLATALDRLAGFNTDDPKRKNGFLVRIV